MKKSKKGELLCDEAVPAANQPFSHQTTCTYMMTGTVSLRVIYTNFTSRRELCAFSHQCVDQLVPVAGHFSFFCFLHWSLLSRFPECSLPSCFIPNPLFWLADRAQLWNSPSQFVSGGNLMSLCPLIIIIVIIIPINVSNSKTRIRLLGGPILQLFWRLWTCYTTGQLTWNCSSNFKNLFGGRPPWTFCFYQENWGRLCEVIESCGEI